MVDNPEAPTPERKSSLDEEGVRRLERQLKQRPEKAELVDKNILKDDRVAPALQATKERLERSRLEDKLGQALLQRPKPNELIRDGILTTDEATVSE